MREECLICKSELEYLDRDIEMKCDICEKKEPSKVRCTEGHYVCNDCHMTGLDSVIGICLAEKSKNPIKIMEKLMEAEFCHMHGPEHHSMVGAALITAYKNSGGDIALEKALKEMLSRGKQLPGGICGFWGACGAAVSTGIFVSIITGTTPLSKESYSLPMNMTSHSLMKIGEIGGPRCCKRNSYLAIEQAINYVKDTLGVEMEKTEEIKCSRFNRNNQCLKEECPFFTN